MYSKICITEVYLLKYYFESHLLAASYLNDAITYRQAIFNQSNILVPYVDIIGRSVPYIVSRNLLGIYVMRHKCVRGGITYISSERTNCGTWSIDFAL